MSDRPRLDRPTLALPSIPGYNEALWETLLQLAGTEPQQEWTLIGGQMVLLHALEHDVEPTRLSTDIDVLINARVVTGGIQSFVKTLESLGFSLVEYHRKASRIATAAARPASTCWHQRASDPART